jgi:hypothetical protein
MILWICGLGLVAGTTCVGYYQGAVRAAITLAGLLLSTLVAIPLGHLIEPLIIKCGVQHPVLLAFLGPVAVFVLLLIILKTGAFFVHRQVEGHYKYRVTDTKRMLWERLNQKLGLCLGIANGVLYFLILSVLVYEIGYATVQFATSEKDSAWMRAVNALGQDMQSTKLVKAIAPFTPAPELYYDGSDMLALIFRNPLIQSRLVRYPNLLLLGEQKQFDELGKDLHFQASWVSQPPIEEFIKQEKLNPLLSDLELYNTVLNTVTPDLPDLKEYLLTGKSAKYDDERILGRWDFDPRTTILMARKKPTITTQELKRLRTVVNGLNRASLIAAVGNKTILKTPRNATEGAWKSDGPGQYRVTVTEGRNKQEVKATIEGNRLLLSRDGFSLVFEK